MAVLAYKNHNVTGLSIKIALGLSAIIVLLAGSAGAVPVEEWNRTFSTNGDDEAYSVQQTSDGGYIMAGYTSAAIFGGGSSNGWLIKTDANGNQQWKKILIEQPLSVQQTSDGGYIFTGCCPRDGDIPLTILTKTDANGNEQWNKTFVGTSVDMPYSDMAFSVQQTSDGGYILGGTRSYAAGGSAAYLIKTDTNGNQQWSKTFGGTAVDLASSVQQTSDGGYILAGARSYAAGGSAAYLIKTGTNGNQQWSKTFGGTDLKWGASSVKQTSDGGYILAGTNKSALDGEVLLIKTDANGNQQWSRTFGGEDDYRGYSVQQAQDGGYAIAGYRKTFMNLPFYSPYIDPYDYSGLLIKTDANGNKQWSMTFDGYSDEEIYSIQKTSDGGYIMAGFTESYGDTGKNAWLIKVSGDTPALQPDFTISASPPSQSIAQGASATYSIFLRSQDGFNVAVSLGAPGLLSGAAASFSPNSVSPAGSSTLAIQTSPSTPAGTYTVTITGTGGGKTHATTINLVVSASSPVKGTITGAMTDASSGLPIAGAIVATGSASTTTDIHGNYSITITPGVYMVTASANGYGSSSAAVTVPAGARIIQNFTLHPESATPTPAPIPTVSGAASIEVGGTGDIISGYDSNGSGRIERDEAVTAVLDFFDGKITKLGALSVVIAYFSSG